MLLSLEEHQLAAATRPPRRAPHANSPLARLEALQRHAGNAATARALRARVGRPTLARDAAGGTPWVVNPLATAAPAPKVQDLMAREIRLLETAVVPPLLARLAEPLRTATSASLAEIAYLARQELERQLNASNPQGQPPLTVMNTVEGIQRAVMTAARQQNIMVPGHRAPGDAAGMAEEAKALAGLSGFKLPDLAIEGSAAGFKFRFDGELSATGKVAGVETELKAGPDGVEGKAGPVTAAVGKDGSGKFGLKLESGPVTLKGDIMAKAGTRTTWSAELEVKLGGGAAPVPDPAALAKMIETAGHDVAAAAEYVGAVATRRADIDKAEVERRLLPAKESIGKVAGTMAKQGPRPPTGPGATLGATVKSEGGGVSAAVTLTITW